MMSLRWDRNRAPALTIAALCVAVGLCVAGLSSLETSAMSQKVYNVAKPDSEWKRDLTDEQYHVTRRKGTERAFTGEYNDCKTPGMYACVCCGAELFDSKAKFDSGTGWPSFFQPASPEAVGSETDRTLWMTRTEVHCDNCGAHLGHVFPDGPNPTGLRYCVNSASLKLKPNAEATDPKS